VSVLFFMEKFMHKRELEAEIESKGDYIQIDYLLSFLRLTPPHEMRKFAYGKLAALYMRHQMFKDAAQAYQNIAINSITFRDKVNNHVLGTKALIEGGFFEDAERSLKRALVDANADQKREALEEVRGFYKELAEDLVSKGKKNKASIYYEKYLRLELGEEKKGEVKEKLRGIYEGLGKISEIKLLEGF